MSGLGSLLVFGELSQARLVPLILSLSKDGVGWFDKLTMSGLGSLAGHLGHQAKPALYRSS